MEFLVLCKYAQFRSVYRVIVCSFIMHIQMCTVSFIIFYECGECKFVARFMQLYIFCKNVQFAFPVFWNATQFRSSYCTNIHRFILHMQRRRQQKSDYSEYNYFLQHFLKGYYFKHLEYVLTARPKPNREQNLILLWLDNKLFPRICKYIE